MPAGWVCRHVWVGVCLVGIEVSKVRVSQGWITKVCNGSHSVIQHMLDWAAIHSGACAPVYVMAGSDLC